MLFVIINPLFRYIYIKIIDLFYLEGGKEMKKIIGILICMLLIFTTISAVGQISKTNPEQYDEIWTKTYGGYKFDFGTHAKETSDGGYIVIGSTCSYGAGDEDVWLLKIDYLGVLEWEKFFGGEKTDFGSDIKPTSDGGYIITGSTASYGNGKQDVWLIKTDANGEMLWDKTFGGVEWDHGNIVLETNDGGFVIVADSDHTGGPSGKAWLIKTDSEGNLLWDKTFGNVGHNSGSSIDFTSDGGFIIVGSSLVPGETNGYDAWLIKTDADGELIWDKKYDGTDMGSDVKETDDGGFIVIGTSNYEYPVSHIWLAKTDSNGEVTWEKQISEFAEDQRGMSVRQTVDGGFIIVAESLLDNIFGFCPIIIKTDNLGEQEWYHHIIKFGNDVIFSVEQTNDEGFIFTGYNTRILRPDLWLIKASADGEIPTSYAGNPLFNKLFDLIQNLFNFFNIF
jgi:hypothetical protein